MIDRQLWFNAPLRVEVRHEHAPRAPGAGEVTVRGLYSGLSQGTEMLLFRGEGPVPFDPSLDSAKSPTYPRRYGYAWVGRVTELGAGVHLEENARVFGLLSHGDAHVVSAESLRLLPSEVPARRAVMLANMETAITIVWDSGMQIGDRVVILGGGIVGLLVTALAVRAGARVTVVEPSQPRKRAAKALGALHVVAPEKKPSPTADVVIEATGDPRSLDLAIAYAGREAAIVVASFYGARTAEVSLGSRFHRERLRLVSSQVSSIPPLRAPRWSNLRRTSLAIDLLRDPAFDALLEDDVQFEDAPRAYRDLQKSPAGRLQVVFRY